jgi:GNAT superfamily N-acetyltransferase
MLVPVPSNLLPVYWPAVRPLIAQACEASRGKWTAEALRKEIEERNAQLWAIYKDEELQAVIVTSIENYPGKRVVTAPIVVGKDRGDWMQHFLEIEDWARQNGCQAVELIARPGWARVLKDYELTHVKLEKDL